MKNSELIEFLRTKQFTRTQAYNLIIGDLDELTINDPIAGATPPLETETGQRLLFYFQYKIQETLLPVIEALKKAGN